MAKRPVPRVEVKIGPQGTMSWPAPLRHRWQTTYVLVEDHGSYAVVRPMNTEDPLATTRQRTAQDN